MNSFFKIAYVTLLSAVFVACNNPNPNPPSPPEPEIAKNSITCEGEKLEFKSVVFDQTLDPLKTRLYIVASAVEGITTYDQMMLQENGMYVNSPLMAYIGYDDINTTFDIMTEIEALFGMSNNTGIGSEIVSFNGGMYQYISAGTFSTTYDQATSTLSLSITATSNTSNKELQANITGKYTPTLSL